MNEHLISVNTARQSAVIQIVQNNSITPIIRILLQVQAKKEPNDTNIESISNDILWVLSQLSQKGMLAIQIFTYLIEDQIFTVFKIITDSKFCIKARMLGIVKLIHNIMKSNISNNKIIFPLLNLMKQLSKHRK